MNLKKTLTASLIEMIPPNARRFIIVDVPDHPNVGDNAIFLGELEFIKANYPNAIINYVDYLSYSPSQYHLLEKADCIFFHGGGNFGDLWMRHHNIRLEIMQQFSHKLLIQFPQSIHFDTEQVLEQTKDAIKNCESFTLIVRDKVSQKFANENFDCSVKLTPDMAFCMQKIERLKPFKDVFCLLRTDKEKLTDKSDAIESLLINKQLSFLIDDWTNEEAPKKAHLNMRFCRIIKKYPRLNFLIQPFYERLRIAYAKDNMKRGIKLLSQGDVVITDRLHAFILSSLLGIENYVFDSRGGKVGNFHKTWANEFANSHLIENVEQLDLRKKTD